MERYKVYFKTKEDDTLNVYYTSASSEQEAIWQWQKSYYAKCEECEFLRVEPAPTEDLC